MIDPVKCPRCGTEGCTAQIYLGQLTDRPTPEADIACTLRALVELLGDRIQPGYRGIR